MKAWVVYDSFFGNTEKIAKAVGDALGPHMDVELFRATDVKSDLSKELKLVVVGSPTRKFNPSPVITSFLKNIPKNGLEGVKVAVFDTRFPEEEIQKIHILAFFVKIFGYAAETIAKKLKKNGGELLLSPEGFFVKDSEGPLLDGELERTADWARGIAAGIK